MQDRAAGPSVTQVTSSPAAGNSEWEESFLCTPPGRFLLGEPKPEGLRQRPFLVPVSPPAVPRPPELPGLGTVTEICAPRLCSAGAKVPVFLFIIIKVSQALANICYRKL